MGRMLLVMQWTRPEIQTPTLFYLIFTEDGKNVNVWTPWKVNDLNNLCYIYIRLIMCWVFN